MGRVLQRAWRELWAFAILLLLLLLLCTDVGDAVPEETLNQTSSCYKESVYLILSVFTSALLPFGGRFPVCTWGLCFCAVNASRPTCPPGNMQSTPDRGPSLRATADTWGVLAPGQTLWSCSHLYIQVGSHMNVSVDPHKSFIYNCCVPKGRAGGVVPSKYWTSGLWDGGVFH